jgi:uncharacterized small protein (DUF1192 family)
MSDETLRLSYSELAQARGVTVATARRMTLRHKWPKQLGNDGRTRVLVPASAVGTAGTTAPDTATVEPVGDATAAAVLAGTAELRDAVAALRDAVAALSAQLAREQERADRAEARVQVLELPLWRRWRRR